MKVLMLSTDSQVFSESSAPRRRILEYGKLVGELHVVVFTRRNFQFSIFNFQKKSKIQISNNTWFYPTNTIFKPLYFWDAYKLGKSIIENCVVTAQDPFETGLVGYLLKKKFNVPLQIQVHTDFLSPYFRKGSWKNKIRVWLGKWLIKKADGIRVVSERIKRSLIFQFPDSLVSKISVLPIFVDIKEIQNKMAQAEPRWADDRPIILTVARLAPEKNLSLAVEVIGEIVKKYPHLRYVIVGAGSEYQNLKLKIKNLKLEKNIAIELWTDDLASYYKSADIFLLTSNYEGYGLAAIEAAAADLPVVMTDVGVAIGQVVPVSDKNALISALDGLLSDKTRRDRLVSEQNKIFQSWTTKADYLSKMKESWQKCLGRSTMM